MNTTERLQLEKKIREEIAKVKNDITSLEASTLPVAPDVAIGRLSRMDAINNKSVAEAALASQKARCNQLNAALSRLDNPDFGFCENCLEPIPMARLVLLPESRFCVSCAE